MKAILAISFGGVAGSLARYYLSLLVQKQTVSAFPYGTLAVNLIGCLFIGFVMQIAMIKPAFSNTIKLFLVTGFAGAFTTFSTFSHETISLFMQNNVSAALTNIVLSNLLGLAAVAIGVFTARFVYMQ